jgi:hypothetical protein
MGCHPAATKRFLSWTFAATRSDFLPSTAHPFAHRLEGLHPTPATRTTHQFFSDWALFFFPIIPPGHHIWYMFGAIAISYGTRSSFIRPELFQERTPGCREHFEAALLQSSAIIHTLPLETV